MAWLEEYFYNRDLLWGLNLDRFRRCRRDGKQGAEACQPSENLKGLSGSQTHLSSHRGISRSGRQRWGLFKQPLACHGYPGLSFELQPPDRPTALEKPKIVGRMFMSADHLYVMQLTAAESSELMANSIKFLDPVPLH